MSSYREPALPYLAFKDFPPRAQDQSLDDCVTAANAWIRDAKIDVINVETVALPVATEMKTSADTVITGSTYLTQDSLGPKTLYRIFQFPRIWYRLTGN